MNNDRWLLAEKLFRSCLRLSGVAGTVYAFCVTDLGFWPNYGLGLACGYSLGAFLQLWWPR